MPMEESGKKSFYGREIISGSPAEDAVVLTTGTTAFTGDLPDGFTALADAQVDIITMAGTTISNMAVPAGATVGVYISSITVDSGTVIVYKP